MEWNIVTKLGGLLLSLIVLGVQAGAALPTAMNYQGRLLVDGAAYTGLADVRATLWSSASGQSDVERVGGPVLFTGVSVSEGVFTISPDFGEGAFGAGARYLQVEVRTPAGTGAFVAVGPRTEILPAPTAQYAERATALGSADGAHQGVVKVTDGGSVVISGLAVFAGPIELAETERTRQLSSSVWTAGAFPIIRGPNGAYVESGHPGPTVQGNCLLPFDLPEGATLRKVEVQYIDASNFGNLTVRVRRATAGASFGSEVAAEASSTGNVPTVRVLTLGSLSVGTSLPLYLEANWTTTTADPIQVGSVKLTYSVTSPLP